MTWAELKKFIETHDERFLNTKVEIFDCETGETILDIIGVNDCSDDFVYDVNHPQLWIKSVVEKSI